MSMLDDPSSNKKSDNKITNDVKPQDTKATDLLALNELPHSRLCLGLTLDDCKQIVAKAIVKEFNQDELLFIEGDSQKQVMLIVSGIVKTSKIGSNGTEAILKLSVPGEIIGARSAQSDVHLYGSTAQAFRCCKLLIWNTSTFESLMHQFPALYKNIHDVLREDMTELETRFHELATEKVNLRIACQLLRLIPKIGKDVNGGTQVGISREELALMTGTTLFSVSRLLSLWASKNIVVSGRESVIIRDVHALRKIADGIETDNARELHSSYRNNIPLDGKHQMGEGR